MTGWKGWEYSLFSPFEDYFEILNRSDQNGTAMFYHSILCRKM